jgi:Stress responsive A/B Barrel Domain
MFLHSVFFYLNNPDSQADHDALRLGLNTLTTIEAITAAYVGTPAETRRPVIDHTYSFGLLLVFADQAAHDVYQEHPTHLQFVADCAHLWQRVQIYDAVS